MVEESGLPPSELALSWKCRNYYALPEAGGMLDQDYGLMHRMAVLENVYQTVAKVRAARGEQIHNLTDADRKLLRGLIDEGLWLNL